MYCYSSDSSFIERAPVFFPNLVISLFLSNRQIFTKNGNKLFSIHQIRHCPPSFLSKFGYFSFSIKPPNIYKKCQKIVFYSSDSSLSSPPRPRRAPFFFPCLRRFMKFSKDASLSNGINNLNSFYKNEKKEVLITVRKFAHIKLMDQIVWNFSIKILFLRYLIKNGKGAFNSYV